MAGSPAALGRFQATMVASAIPAVSIIAWWDGLFSGAPRSYIFLLAGIVAFTLVVVGLFRAWRPAELSGASLLSLAAVVAFACYCGPATAFATVLLMLCAISILPERWMAAGVGGVMGGVVFGLAVLAGMVGWLLPFPVHDGRGYLAFAALLCVLRRDVIAARLRVIGHGWRALERDAGDWLPLAVCAASIASLGLWLPTMNYDDNAAHLILPYQLLVDGYYHLDVTTQAWAVAPWANNALNGIAALLAGIEARAAVNALWLVVGLHGAWQLAVALGASTRAALAAAVVYATLPLTGYFTTTMQVDGASTAVLMQFAALLVSSGRALPPAIMVGAMLGLLAGLKATNAIYALPAIAWLGWQAFRQREWAWLARVTGMALLLGGASYFYSTLITANPLFPLFNATFKSPYFPPTNLVDARWMGEMSWGALWNMTFETGRFGEHYPGAFGIALLALSPALLVEAARHAASRAVALWFLASGLLMFVQIQYIRYLFPATAVLVVVGIVGLARLLPPKPFAAMVAVLAVADALLLPATSWLLRDDPWSKLILHGPSAARMIEAEKVPERALLRRLLAGSPGACIIIANPETPFGASAGGHAVVAKAPYDSRMARTYEWANADASGKRWEQVLAATGTSHVIAANTPSPALQRALEADGFARVDVEGASTAWAVAEPGQRTCTGRLEQSRDEAHRRLHPGDMH